LFTDQALNIITSSLQSGAIGTSYSGTLVANGGVLPYTWSVFSGNLPPGLALVSLNSIGNISGTPTAAGTYSMTFRVVDAAQTQAFKSLSITISAPPHFSIITTSLPPATQGQNYSQT